MEYISLYDVLRKSGINLFFDLKRKDIRYKKHQIMKDGVLVTDHLSVKGEKIDISNLPLITEDEVTDNPYKVMEQLYHDFKYSLPYEGRKFLFPVAKELTNTQMLLAKRRVDANNTLEGFLLLAGLEDLIPWEDEEKWFYITKSGLVIKKEFIRKKVALCY